MWWHSSCALGAFPDLSVQPAVRFATDDRRGYVHAVTARAATRLRFFWPIARVVWNFRPVVAAYSFAGDRCHMRRSLSRSGPPRFQQSLPFASIHFRGFPWKSMLRPCPPLTLTFGASPWP